MNAGLESMVAVLHSAVDQLGWAPAVPEDHSPKSAHAGFVDTLIIIFVSAAIVIFLLWAASRATGLEAFERLPSWLQDSYKAIWSSIAAGTAGVGLAVFKVLTRKESDRRPNYLLLIGITTGCLLVAIFLLLQIFKAQTNHEATSQPSAPSVPSTDAEARKILSDYAARLHDLDRLVKEADNSTDIETNGADSILVYRIAYGAAEYRTSLPEFQNVPWATLIRKLEEAGVPDSTANAIKATDTLMNGPYVGQDTHKRGYFGPGVLDAQANTLQAYYNAAHKHFYGQ
jgi:hypothetical protein